MEKWKTTLKSTVGKLWMALENLHTENLAFEVAWHPWRSCKQLWIRWQQKRRPQTRRRKTLLCRHWWPSTRSNRELMRIGWELFRIGWELMRSMHMFSWFLMCGNDLRKNLTAVQFLTKDPIQGHHWWWSMVIVLLRGVEGDARKPSNTSRAQQARVAQLVVIRQSN